MYTVPIMNTNSEHMQVAQTILEQLGGNRFKVMTGAHSFCAETDNSLIFKLPKRGCTFGVKIRLTPEDTYEVSFITVRNGKVKSEVVDGVYCDMLREVFENHTGLRTSL